MANQPTKYRKFVVGAASAALVASAVAPVASAKDFSDTKGNTHEAAIDALSDAGIINGYEDGTFKPNKTLTRSDVVKMMGKWLVAEGYEVPSDYKTNPRFTDLTSATNDELLKYAAVVKDNGVFNGSNGRLLAGDNMSRENMAVVLVRAFDTVKDINLVEHVQGNDYKKEVTDLNSAKSEARPAIEVLDFFDVTTVAQFNPKDTTTRGHFATFLNNFLKADLSKVTGVVAGVESITAVNNTTVEVKFVSAVEDLADLKFAIEGLEVTNKVIKQTDAKTVVLTTSVQEAGKTYTVTANDSKLGTFNGPSAVVPTSIKVTTPSVQGTIGKEVTVAAQVTVPDGQSKAGIPVTFNIVNDNSNLNSKIEVVAYTNDEGVAQHTYTRYYQNNDSFTAYATSKSSVFSSGKVYWAEGITLTEVTESNTLANGAKKVYKIKTNSYATETNGTPSTADDYNYVNVAFAENLDVTPDKLVRDVEVIDTGVATNAKYPSQVTTGGVNEVRVKVNASGEATFTLTGSNASVTPIVFVDANPKNGKYAATELQAKASTVKFELAHTLGLSVTAEGVQNAAAINNANENNKGTGEGGRDYTVTVTDKNGKVAPAGTVAYVTFESGNYSTDKKAYILNADGERVEIKRGTVQAIKVAGTKGEASFTLVGQHDAFAAPTVYLENGKESGLDSADLQVVGETTYFVTAVINDAALTVTNEEGKKADKVINGQLATFTYQSVDQNGFDYYAGNGRYEVTFEVTAQFGDVDVYSASDALLGTVKKGTTKSFVVNSSQGTAAIKATSDVVSTINVQASASQVSLPNKSASVEVTATPEITVFNGGLTAVNKSTNVVYITNAAGVTERFTYTGADFYDGATAAGTNIPLNETDFEALLTENAELAYKKVGDNKQFYVTVKGNGTAVPTAPIVTPTNNAPVAKAVGTQTVAANADNLTFTASELATDADDDELSIVTAYTSNATIATAAPSGAGNVELTVDPKAVGTTTVTAVVTDGNGGFVTVNFDVVVTAGVFFTVVNSGNPTIPYAVNDDAQPASTTIDFTGGVTVAGNLSISVGSDVVTVAVETTDTAATVAAKITSAAEAIGYTGIETEVDGTELTISTVETGSDVNLVVASNITIGATPYTGADVDGDDATEREAAYSFRVNNPAAGTLTVTLGAVTDTVAVSAGDSAATIAAALDLTGYTATAVGNNVVLTQDTAAPTGSTKLVVSFE